MLYDLYEKVLSLKVLLRLTIISSVFHNHYFAFQLINQHDKKS